MPTHRLAVNDGQIRQIKKVAEESGFNARFSRVLPFGSRCVGENGGRIESHDSFLTLTKGKMGIDFVPDIEHLRHDDVVYGAANFPGAAFCEVSIIGVPALIRAALAGVTDGEGFKRHTNNTVYISTHGIRTNGILSQVADETEFAELYMRATKVERAITQLEIKLEPYINGLRRIETLRQDLEAMKKTGISERVPLGFRSGEPVAAVIQGAEAFILEAIRRIDNAIHELERGKQLIDETCYDQQLKSWS